MPQWAILLWGGTLPLGLSRSPEVQLQQLASMVGTSRSALGNLLEATASLGVLPDAAHHLASCLRPCHICFTLASASCAVTGAAPGVPWLDTTSTVTFRAAGLVKASTHTAATSARLMRWLPATPLSPCPTRMRDCWPASFVRPPGRTTQWSILACRTASSPANFASISPQRTLLRMMRISVQRLCGDTRAEETRTRRDAPASVAAAATLAAPLLSTLLACQ
mmetsp:Transcript_34121/g.101457  ORF Transcript_34121/g.101457 Transcript_34121/m.101457 type:complete len:222 (-) Transcript_34121:478-1143(-)